MKGVFSGIKFLIKWGAVIFVFVEILEFAHEKLSKVWAEKMKDEKEVSNG